MADFIATLAPERYGNWEVCKQTGLWGVVGRGSNWRSNGMRVQAGDRIYIWRGGRPNGFIAELEAQGPMRLTSEPGVNVPWDEPDWFGGVIPMRVVAELPAPVGDSFANASRVGARFGFNNTVLQHIFEEIPAEVAERVAEVFPATPSQVGQPYTPATPPGPVATGEPFDVDPDAVDRGLQAHHETATGGAAVRPRLGGRRRRERCGGQEHDQQQS